VNLHDQSGNHMTIVGVKSIPRPIQIGRHDRDTIVVVLAALGLAQLDAGDFRHRVEFVGKLERAA
jgi:hypothetical protein